MFGTTNNLNDHLSYTMNEWTTCDYYKKVLYFLKQKNIKNFIDIGSCTGIVSDILTKNINSLEKCILLEANTENYNFIKNRLNLDNNKIIINKALFYNQDYINIGSVRTNVGGWSYQSDVNSFKIPTITLEKIIEENIKFLGSTIDFVKIDVEGAEYNIIQNSNILKKIPYIEIEFHPNSDFNMTCNEDIKYLYDLWYPFIKENLPNHKLIYGGKNEKVIWPNGQEVCYDGSGFFVLESLL